MPLVTRKRRLEADGDKFESNRPKRLKTGRKDLCECDRIGYSQDHYHSLHRSLPEEHDSLQKILAKEIGSFLNGKGGILCFGCRENGTVYGNDISRKEEDNLKLIIDEVFKKFRPIVEPQNYRVTFTHLRQWTEWSARVVLEIRVQAGDQHEMYEDYNHETYLRQKDAPYGPLVPHEIKRFTTQQLRQKLKAIRPIQKLLRTPTKESSTLDRDLGTQKITTTLLGNKNGEMRIRVLRRLDSSSGSDEDPISIAIVKPMVSEVAKRTTTQQEDRAGKDADAAKVATQDSSKDGNGALSTKAAPPEQPSVKSAANAVRRQSSSHPLAQSVKSTVTSAVSRPSQTPKPKHAVTTRSQNASPTSKSATPKPTATARPILTGSAATSKTVNRKPATNSTSHSSATCSTSKVPTRNSNAHPHVPVRPVSSSSGPQYPTRKRDPVPRGGGRMIPTCTSTYRPGCRSAVIRHHPPQRSTHHSLPPPPPPPPRPFHSNVIPPHHMHYVHHSGMPAHMVVSQATSRLRSGIPSGTHVNVFRVFNFH